jgi:ketosteroid isomerase-like protein
MLPEDEIRMSSSNVDVVTALYRAFAARDLGAIAELIGPEVTVRQTELLPWGGFFEGLVGFRRFTELLLQNVDSLVTPEEYVDAGDRVVAIARTRGHVRQNNAPFDIRAVHVWGIRDGKAISFEAYIDTPAMLEALAKS